MNISVVIPTYKRTDDLNRLLNSIAQQTEIPKEIIVIIGPEDGESLAIAQSWQLTLFNLIILNSPKPSVVHALNLGLNITKEEIICLLDDDVYLPPDWANKIRIAFENNPLLGAYGGRDHLQSENNSLSAPPLATSIGSFYWNGTFVGNHHCGSISSPIEVDVLKGANLSFRRSAFSVMHIDEALEEKGAETCWEIDLCQSIKKTSFSIIYDNNNYILHFASLRQEYDNRHDIFSPAWSRRGFNKTFVIAKFRPLYEITFFLLRSILIGSRFQPGIIWAILLIPKYNWKVLVLLWVQIKVLHKGLILGLKRRYEIFN